MRIVAGIARGRPLSAPPGDKTRPTTDRVREAMFSTVQSLAGAWEGTRVLDIFAGSGALGLEALSRGARCALLVESDRRVVRTLRANVDRIGLPGAVVHVGDVGELAARSPDPRSAGAASTPADRVLCDPPYSLSGQRIAEILEGLARHSWLAPGCVVVVERPSRDDSSPWPQGEEWQSQGHRTYGDTALWYGRFAPTVTGARPEE